MKSPYKRRRSSLIRNLIVYRRLVGAAALLGLVLWFVLINNAPVTVYFPFRLGTIVSTSGLVILLGFFAGAVVTSLIATVFFAVRRFRQPTGARDDLAGGEDLAEDRPPSDYAAKTTDGFGDAPWGRG